LNSLSLGILKIYFRLPSLNRSLLIIHCSFLISHLKKVAPEGALTFFYDPELNPLPPPPPLLLVNSWLVTSLALPSMMAIALMVVVRRQRDGFGGVGIAVCDPVIVILIVIYAVAEHIYLAAFGIVFKRHTITHWRGGIDGDGGQTGAAHEGSTVDAGHVSGNLDAGQTGAAMEGIVADARHAVGNIDAGQTSEVRECFKY
jgi:hypothetical protein